ncbi:alpha/beta hydrolase [Saccharopolyspora hordei]|uniref:Acyl-CoA:diacylglycerol acyltransferase n=1 Tax=Saccharopolyspora hordei TaxID=1838 RepID=A0A853AU16_9PSEU|nr:alpha/beta hydrolase-fold protein [Saccharopolyspora hordei]NYI86131.1 S-formylglutathione hydrolase FrmB [Saccharopolyspora hordei]
MRDSRGRHLLPRRSVLAAGLTGAAALGLGLGGQVGSAPRETAVPLANQPNVSVERLYSRARNRSVNFVLMFPEGVPRRDLPVCLMLHGRFGDARKSAAGLPDWLSQSVAAGRIPPFAFLAVDGGGNNYWHRRPNDDPLWMLLGEVPRWLAERNLGGRRHRPFAAAGISMGGFGALLYARRRREMGHPLTAAAVVSPALITSWPEMRKRKAFANEAEWAAIDPLRHIKALGDLPLGVWCGTEDRFIEGTRRFIRLADPEYASTTPGGHNSRYYRKALPELVDFIGTQLAESGEHR